MTCPPPTIAEYLTRGIALVNEYNTCLVTNCIDGGADMVALLAVDVCEFVRTGQFGCDVMIRDTNCGVACTVMAGQEGGDALIKSSCPKLCGVCTGGGGGSGGGGGATNGTVAVGAAGAAAVAGTGTGAGGISSVMSSISGLSALGTMTEATCASPQTADRMPLDSISTPLLIIAIGIFAFGFVLLPLFLTVWHPDEKFREDQQARIFGIKKKDGSEPKDGRLKLRQRLLWFMGVVCLGLLALGQGMVSFDVDYGMVPSAEGASGNAFRYDFWTGVAELWNLESFLMSLALIVCSGIWPFVKNTVMVHATVFRKTPPQTEYKWLRRLGVLGKFGLMDVILVALVVAVISVDAPLGGGSAVVAAAVPPGSRMQSNIQSVAPQFAASPRKGCLVIIIDLLLARLITTAVIHFLPPGSIPSVFGRTPSKSADAPAEQNNQESSSVAVKSQGPSLKSPLGIIIFLAGFISAVFVGLGFVSSIILVERDIKISVQLTPETDPVQVAALSDDFGLWEILKRCGEADFLAGEKDLRQFMSYLALVLVLVLGIFQGLVVAACCVVCFMGKEKTSGMRMRLLHTLQILTEWASLDVTVLGLIVFKSDIKTLGANLGRLLVGSICTKMDISIEYGVYFWLMLLAAVLSDVGAVGVLFSKEYSEVWREMNEGEVENGGDVAEGKEAAETTGDVGAPAGEEKEPGV